MEKRNSPGDRPRLTLARRILIALLRLFFRLLYHQFAWTYDWVAKVVSLGAWQSWVCSILPYLNGPRVLEIGFGPGHLLVKLQQKGFTVLGLDESRQMTRIAHQRFSGVSPSPSLMRGKAESLPLVSESIDQVVMTFPAEFITKQQSLMEIRRVLVIGGSAIAIPVAWITGRKPWERAAAWVNRITGEAPEWDENALEPLRKLGFDVTWEMIELPASRVLIVRLTKPQAT